MYASLKFPPAVTEIRKLCIRIEKRHRKSFPLLSNMKLSHLRYDVVTVISGPLSLMNYFSIGSIASLYCIPLILQFRTIDYINA